jgi:predicted RNase H-like HicB family nuclease
VILSIEVEVEDDSRWIAETLEIPGVMCYGSTREEATGNTERLAFEVIADRVAHGEMPVSTFNVTFVEVHEAHD